MITRDIIAKHFQSVTVR